MNVENREFRRGSGSAICLSSWLHSEAVESILSPVWQRSLSKTDVHGPMKAGRSKTKIEEKRILRAQKKNSAGGKNPTFIALSQERIFSVTFCILISFFFSFLFFAFMLSDFFYGSIEKDRLFGSLLNSTGLGRRRVLF